MKHLFAICLVIMAGCGGQDTNKILYNQVMDIHDEVMPRMEDLYNIKKDIEEKLKDPAALAEGQEERLKKRLAQVDSVSKLMMTWMHEFDPPPDTADKDQTRAYLEGELERIKVVKQAMLEAIAEGATAND